MNPIPSETRPAGLQCSKTFEESLAELEAIVRDLEDGQTGLEEALARYEQGVGLLKRCYTQLREAEQRILLLTGADEENQPILTPFQHSATAGETAKPEPKRAVRKRPDEPRTTY
jgi:exodeoxyribonuclease VII small subunit